MKRLKTNKKPMQCLRDVVFYRINALYISSHNKARYSFKLRYNINRGYSNRSHVNFVRSLKNSKISDLDMDIIRSSIKNSLAIAVYPARSDLRYRVTFQNRTVCCLW